MLCVRHYNADATKNISTLSIQGGTRLTGLLSLPSNYAGIMFIITWNSVFYKKKTTYLSMNLCIHVLSNSTNLISLSLSFSFTRNYIPKQVSSQHRRYRDHYNNSLLNYIYSQLTINISCTNLLCIYLIN